MLSNTTAGAAVVGVMAEFFWAKTYRSAAAAMLVILSVLALIDRLTRPDLEAGSTAADAMSWIAVGLGAAGILSLMVPLEDRSKRWRLAPAAAGVAGLLIATTIGDIVGTDGASLGITVAIVVILAYVGLTLPPGFALVLAPVLLVVVLVGRTEDSSSLTLALPLIAVPVAAMVAELISHLAQQSDAASDRSTRRMEQLARLEEVLRRFRRPGSLAQAADQVAEAAKQIFEVERSTVVLRDSAGELISVTSGPRSLREPSKDTSLIVAETISGEQPRLVPTGANGTMLVLPLPAPEAPAGAVLVYPVSTEDPSFTLDLARLFGVQVGIAIEHLFVIDELARANTRDELTGIGNRKHADALLRSLQPGDALVLLDLDGFKKVNDTLGHSAGDQVLQDLSAHLRDCLRDSDTSARLGGDEFLIVARRAHADPLAVASRVLNGWAHKEGQTTLSAGVALHQVDPTDPTTLGSQVTFERADRALYQAKAKGKNRAQLWIRPTQESPST